MAESNPTEESPARPPRGAAAAHFRLALCAAIFVMVNVLSCARFVQIDFTREQVFSLSPVTRQVVAALPQEARIIVAFGTESPVAERTWRLARAYADARPGVVRADLLDPLRQPAEAHALSNRYGGLSFRDNLVLVALGDRIETIPESALEIRRTDERGRSESLGFTGEDAITAALVRLIEGKPRPVYLITGKGPWPAGPQSTGADMLRAILPRINARLIEFSFDEAESLPEDAAAIIIANPRYDFSGREIRQLREYWEQRKGGLLVLVNPSAPVPNLDAFLRFHGIRVDRRTPMKIETGPLGARKTTEVPIRFLPGHPLTNPFANTDARLPGTSAFLEVDQSDDVRGRGLRPFEIAQSESSFWAEANPLDPIPKFDAVEDQPGPLTLIAGVERGAVSDARLRVPAARMAVFANPHLMDPQTLVQANVDFLLSALNWSMDRQELVGIGPKQPVLFRLALSPVQQRVMQYITLGLMPLVALVSAWLVHLRRRS